jgi:hypothetical protein
MPPQGNKETAKNPILFNDFELKVKGEIYKTEKMTFILSFHTNEFALD